MNEQTITIDNQTFDLNFAKVCIMKSIDCIKKRSKRNTKSDIFEKFWNLLEEKYGKLEWSTVYQLSRNDFYQQAIWGKQWKK